MKKLSAIVAALLLSLTIAAQNTITTDTVIQTSTCAGSQIIVPYDAIGTFPLGNLFIAELSDNFGQFSSPVNIGQSSFNLGYIFATIPANATFSFLYKIRVISTNPAVTGTECPNNIFITSAPITATIVTTGDTICLGDTTTLSVLAPGLSYQWSTGDTTQSIQVSQGGSYSVVVTDLTGCTASDTSNIFFTACTGINEVKDNNSTVLIYPNPTSGNLTIQNISPEQKSYDLKIYNILQTTIYSSKLKPHTSNKIDLSDFAKGIYFVKIYDGIEFEIRKIVVQ